MGRVTTPVNDGPHIRQLFRKIITHEVPHKESRKCVVLVVCVKIGNGTLSNTTMSIKMYLMSILDNYMFRPLLAIFRLSSRELKFLLYTLCAHVVQRSLHRCLIA